MFSVLDIFTREFCDPTLLPHPESNELVTALPKARELWHVFELNCQRPIALEMQTLCEQAIRLTLAAAPSRIFEAWRVAVWVVPAWGKTLILLTITLGSVCAKS
jgi:hypothetical protein